MVTTRNQSATLATQLTIELRAARQRKRPTQEDNGTPRTAPIRGGPVKTHWTADQPIVFHQADDRKSRSPAKERIREAASTQHEPTPKASRVIALTDVNQKKGKGRASDQHNPTPPAASFSSAHKPKQVHFQPPLDSDLPYSSDDSCTSTSSSVSSMPTEDPKPGHRPWIPVDAASAPPLNARQRSSLKQLSWRDRAWNTARPHRDRRYPPLIQPYKLHADGRLSEMPVRGLSAPYGTGKWHLWGAKWERHERREARRQGREAGGFWRGVRYLLTMLGLSVLSWHAGMWLDEADDWVLDRMEGWERLFALPTIFLHTFCSMAGAMLMFTVGLFAATLTCVGWAQWRWWRMALVGVLGLLAAALIPHYWALMED